MDYKPEIKEYMNTLPKFLQTAIVEANVPISSVEQLKALEQAYRGEA